MGGGSFLVQSDKTIRIWDAETGALQQTLQGHTGWVRSVALSHDGRRLVSGSDDETIRIWDAETGVLQQTLQGHTGWVTSVAFSHDGRRLVSGSDDETIRIWDAETGALQQTLQGHTGWVGNTPRQLSFSLDDSHLVTNLGSITLSQFPLLPTQTFSWSAYCLQGDQSWITWNGNNVLWLHPEYRPYDSIVKDQTIAIGCASGRVLLIRFNPDVWPTCI